MSSPCQLLKYVMYIFDTESEGDYVRRYQWLGAPTALSQCIQGASKTIRSVLARPEFLVGDLYTLADSTLSVFDKVLGPR